MKQKQHQPPSPAADSWGGDGGAADSDALNAALRAADSADDEPIPDGDVSPDALRKRRAQEAAWQASAASFQQHALRAAPRVEQLRRSGPLTPALVEAAASLEACSRCGSADIQRCTAPNGGRVRFVSTLGCWDVTIPVFFCNSCLRTVHAHPLQCGCFPATPVKALDLRLNNTGESPVWFDEHALLHMVHLQNKSLETADEAVVEAMNRMCAKVGALPLTPPQGRFRTE